MILQRDPDVLQMILALGAPCRLARRLDRGQQQSHQNADDCNHNQQFDQRKCTTHVKLRHTALAVNRKSSRKIFPPSGRERARQRKIPPPSNEPPRLSQNRFYALLRRKAAKASADVSNSRADVGSGTPDGARPAPAPAFAKRTLSMIVVIFA